MIDKTADYWSMSGHEHYKRPEYDYWHPSMPSRRLGQHFGTMWYELLEDCMVIWDEWGGAHYHEGMIVHEKRSKPITNIVNYEWLRRQADDKGNS